ncbi:MAG TPA: TolC family protein [Puia sp.]|nr:TolC family protein [Puia sp.]
MKQRTIKRNGLAAVIVLLMNVHLHAQDTVRITLREAEKQFLEKNLALLAERYNVDIARAGVIQASLYSNPNLSLTGNIYNPQEKKPFDISSGTGEYIIQVQQLIRLAGKRNKEIGLAVTNGQLSENRFFDLMRTLRFSLRSNFFNAYYTLNSVNAYQSQLASLEKLNAAYEGLQSQGIVTLKDALRIKSLLYSLKGEQTTLLNQLNDIQADLRVLLQNNKATFIPVAEERDDSLSASLKQLDLARLIDTAYAYRHDLLLANNNLLYSRQNYALQKALATPDLQLGAQFDKRGSFVENASFLTLAMDLPFFHRNQGNIKAARIAISQNEIIYKQQMELVENEVRRAYAKALTTDNMLSYVDPGFRDQFEKLLQGITENFQKKNISLIEFTDFYESYKNNILQFNQLGNDRMQAIEALQFSVGKPIFSH